MEQSPGRAGGQARSAHPTWCRRELLVSPWAPGRVPVCFMCTLFMVGSLATLVALPLLPLLLTALGLGEHFLFFPMSLSSGVCASGKPPWACTGSSLAWWMKGPRESVASPLLTITLILLMDSAGLPLGGPLPDCSCRRLDECALFVTQLRLMLWEDVTADV